MAKTTTETPEAETSVLSTDAFDVFEWLNGSSYPGKLVEVFNKGQQLADIAELSEDIERLEVTLQERSRNLIGQQSIADLDPADALNEAKARVEELLEELKGTGVTFKLQGIAPEARKVLTKALERKFKPKPAVYEGEGDDRVVVEPPILGGRDHPDFNQQLELELVTKSIIGFGPTGRVVDGPMPMEQVEAFRKQLMDPEWRRVANAVFGLNYVSYDIDSKVTLDF